MELIACLGSCRRALVVLIWACCFHLNRAARLTDEVGHLMHDLGPVAEADGHRVTNATHGADSCLEKDHRMLGCKSRCLCAWGQQCYPKFMSVREAGLIAAQFNGHERNLNIGNHSLSDVVNVGVCETSMVVLFVSAFMLFVFVLFSFIGIRTFAQWWEFEKSSFEGVPEDVTDQKGCKHGSGLPPQQCSTFASDRVSGASTASQEPQDVREIEETWNDGANAASEVPKDEAVSENGT